VGEFAVDNSNVILIVVGIESDEYVERHHE